MKEVKFPGKIRKNVLCSSHTISTGVDSVVEILLKQSWHLRACWYKLVTSEGKVQGYDKIGQRENELKTFSRANLNNRRNEAGKKPKNVSQTTYIFAKILCSYSKVSWTKWGKEISVAPHALCWVSFAFGACCLLHHPRESLFLSPSFAALVRTSSSPPL